MPPKLCGWHNRICTCFLEWTECKRCVGRQRDHKDLRERPENYINQGRFWDKQITKTGRRATRHYVALAAGLVADCSMLRNREKPELYQSCESRKAETFHRKAAPSPCECVRAFQQSLTTHTYISGKKKKKKKIIHQHCFSLLCTTEECARFSNHLSTLHSTMPFNWTAHEGCSVNLCLMFETKWLQILKFYPFTFQ